MAMGTAMEWQYVYEALQNVRCLQLLLFHPSEIACVDFTAVVRHGSPLWCAWNDSQTLNPHSLAVPLPACLLDLSLPVRCWTRQDHVEIRLGLLSLDPALHALQLSLLDLGPVRKPETKPFSVDFDAQTLESSDGVQFFCRTCSCQLTNAPFRRVIEVPSLDWCEVSEHFYRNCCCASFGAQAEVLAARFQQLLTSSEGTCLVASTTCIVHKGDVLMSEGGRDSETIAAELLHRGQNDSDPCAVSQIGVEIFKVYISDMKEKVKDESCAGDHFEHHSKKSECDHHLNGGNGRATVSVADEIHVSGTKVPPEGFESETHQDTEEDPSCCSSRKSASTESSSVKEASPESLGNGFMTGPGSRSEVLDWEPFFCRSCSSLVGARRGDSSKNGVQFFKCKISTHKLVSSSSNIFREHTLERLFTHELAKNTESDSLYRYVVRSFQTGAALLQLVLLNQNALVSSGTVTSNSGDTATETAGPPFLDKSSGCQAAQTELNQIHDTKPANVSLKTVAKFMFCDCRMLGLEELRLIDKWAQIQRADDIFVLDEVAETLVDLLKSNQLAYPPSCQSFQQFSLSFLTK